MNRLIPIAEIPQIMEKILDTVRHGGAMKADIVLNKITRKLYDALQAEAESRGWSMEVLCSQCLAHAMVQLGRLPEPTVR